MVKMTKGVQKIAESLTFFKKSRNSQEKNRGMERNKFVKSSKNLTELSVRICG